MAPPRWLPRATRLRPAILLTFAALLALSLVGARELRFDFTPQRIFESDDPAHAELREVQRVFGQDDNLLLVHVRTPELFAPAAVAAVRSLHAALERAPHVEAVDSPASAWVLPPGSSLPRLLLPPGLERGPGAAAALAEARAAALSEPLVAGRVVSPDGRAALIVAHLDPTRGRYAELKEVVDGCLAALRAVPLPPGVEVLPTGIPVARVLIVRRLISDQLTYFPVCTVLFIAILWLVFHDLRAVAVPLFAVLVSLIYLVGVLGATGESVDIINNVLPVLVFVIGISDAIHLITRYRRELGGGRARLEALGISLRHLLLACLLTSVTTAVGFGSLVAADVSILQRFGVYAAVGVLIAYAVTVVLVPLLFSYLSPILPPRSQAADRVVDRCSAWLAELTIRHRWAVVAVGLLLLGGALAAATRIEVENNVYEAFPTGDPVVEANRRIERDFAGVVPVSLVVSWRGGGGPPAPEVLRYVADLQGVLAAEGLRPISLVDLLAQWNVAMHRGDPAYRRPPDSALAARQGVIVTAATLERAGRGALLGSLWAPSARMLRIRAHAGDIGSNALGALWDRIEARLAADGAKQAALGIEARLTGDGPVASRGIDRLITDLFSSLLLAFAIILPTLCLLLRSVKAGLVSMIPNVTPLLLTLGFMGVAGMDLRVTSVIVFTVSLGLAVDDTIHFMARLREEWRPEVDGPLAYEQALRRTFRGTGGAIVVTSVLLAAGFTALLLSAFPISRTFAVCMEITVLGALAADLLLLPACILILRPFGPAPALADPGGPLGDAPGGAADEAPQPIDP